MAQFIKQKPLLIFFILAFAFSWVVYINLVFMRQGWTQVNIPYALHYLASFGPMLAAFIVTGIIGGRAGLGELWGRITKWRVKWPYAAFAFLSPLALFCLATFLIRIFQGEWPDLRLLGQVNYLPYLGWGVLIVWIITFGFGEEIGWRGFALPRLQKTMSVSRATLILGLVWALWHVPAFFYHETYINMEWYILPGFIFGVLCGSVLFTWLYNGSGGSVLMVAIWHALYDLTTASAVGRDFIPFLTSAGVIAFALFISNVKKPWGFLYQDKQKL
jgi:uncharacterized protein